MKKYLLCISLLFSQHCMFAAAAEAAQAPVDNNTQGLRSWLPEYSTTVAGSIALAIGVASWMHGDYVLNAKKLHMKKYSNPKDAQSKSFIAGYEPSLLNQVLKYGSIAGGLFHVFAQENNDLAKYYPSVCNPMLITCLLISMGFEQATFDRLKNEAKAVEGKSITEAIA